MLVDYFISLVLAGPRSQFEIGTFDSTWLIELDTPACRLELNNELSQEDPPQVTRSMSSPGFQTRCRKDLTGSEHT